MNSNRYIFTLILAFFICNQTFSQASFAGIEMTSDFERGMELFTKEKYPAAIHLFDSYINNPVNTEKLVLTEAEYYRALAAIRLFHPDAEYRMATFISRHPESPRLNEAKLILGDYFYQNKNYRKSITYYEQVNRQELKTEDLPEYFFRLGYSHFVRGDKSRALLMFSEIKDIDTEYTSPALYYFSHIAYEQEMYQTAMDGFTRLQDDETFGSVVPFYIVQILYLEKDYDRILEIAPDLITLAGKERAIELYRFIGDAHYNKEDYEEALPWLEKFATETRISDREDKFQLGYCYYKTNQIDEALKIFLELGAGNDALSQNIWFLLGECYLRKGNKKRAQFGFSEASKMDYDKKLKEEALFNYAKITYETSYSPFGEATASFQKYIELYPASERIEEAYSYLISTYLQAKNYKAALASLDRIKSNDPRLEEAYQRVAFFRGLELFRNMELDATINMFDKSLRYEKYDRQIKARTLYWRGEANYRLGNYEDAKADYKAFMATPGSMNVREYGFVRYNLGYTLYNLRDFEGALTHLKTFEYDVTGVNPDVMADARNRIGDCYYITTNYADAIAFYNKVIDYGRTDADYAMFQKGFSLGLMNDESGKAEVLTLLTERYPESPYVPNAIFERGRAYVMMDEFKKGEDDFNKIITLYGSTPFAPRAMVQLGLLYYNLGENEKAVVQYKKVIEDFKSTPEARSALTGLKNVYIEMNDVDAYFAYLKTLQGYGDVNMTEKDSLLYTSGENLYIEGNYPRATEIFRNYLNEFSRGIFLQNAQFYLAECLKSTGYNDEALEYYTIIAEAPDNQFTEQALLSAASISYNNEDYTSSLKYYEMLEKAAVSPQNRLTALKGELRSSYQLGDARKTIEAANKINNAENIPEELLREAIFMRAKANYSLNNFSEALEDFRKTAIEVASEEGAESKYRVADLLYRQDKLTEAEQVITEFIDQNTPHQYWMARVFLLLADISIKKGDLLQARGTLLGLKDYYTIDDDGILDEVRSRLDALDQNDN
jgi:TolA-binding protein